MSDTQQSIAEWFDHTYRTRSFKYLRPPEAYDLFGTLLAPEPESMHLDVACGPGLMLKTMHNRGAKAYGVDISVEAVRMAEEYCPSATVAQANAEQLPFDDGMFDSVSCIGSLERMIDRKAALAEMLRVSKDHARICLMVRNSEHFIWKYFIRPAGLANKKGHQDALNLKAWSELFEACNFRIEAIYPDHWPYIRLLRLLRPWKKADASRVRRFPFRLDLAYEFIFVLRKA